MRIIAGEFRGRKLLAPESDATRPVTDRVKQSVFDILAPLLPGAVVYDCFAGTGSMGLECLSRGASHVTFFESDKSAAGLLRKNIQTLGVDPKSKVIAGDLFKQLSDLRSPRNDVDVVFLDPPYRYLNERPKEIQKLAEAFAAVDLKADGLVVFRHDAEDLLELPGLAITDVRTYGSMSVEFLTPNSALRAAAKKESDGLATATDHGQPTTDI
jgi:16S rRNA (guanine966-N2)-methyltransferase